LGVDIVAYDKMPTSNVSSRRKFARPALAPEKASDAQEDTAASSSSGARFRNVNEYHRDVPAFTKVLRGDAHAVTLFADRTLFLCYPPPNDPMALECLQAYQGDTVAYVGEWMGQTASRAFEQELCKQFRCVKVVELPNFTNTIYQLSVWKKKATTGEELIEEEHGSVVKEEVNRWVFVWYSLSEVVFSAFRWCCFFALVAP
jgi:hypothetical protein